MSALMTLTRWGWMECIGLPQVLTFLLICGLQTRPHRIQKALQYAGETSQWMVRQTYQESVVTKWEENTPIYSM
jgi:hypothetical protein